MDAGGGEDRRQALDQRPVDRAGETRPERRGGGDVDLPLRGARTVQRIEPVHGERTPLLGRLQRLVVAEQRIAYELIGEHHRRFPFASGEHCAQRLDRRRPAAIAIGDIHGLCAADVDRVRREADPQLLVTPQK